MIKTFIFLQISQKGKTIVDFPQANGFAFQRLFLISHILANKLEFLIFNSVFKIKTLNINFMTCLYSCLYSLS